MRAAPCDSAGPPTNEVVAAQGSDPESFPSASAAVLVSAACEPSAPQLMRHVSHAVPSDDHTDADAAKLVRAAPLMQRQTVPARQRAKLQKTGQSQEPWPGVHLPNRQVVAVLMQASSECSSHCQTPTAGLVMTCPQPHVLIPLDTAFPEHIGQWQDVGPQQAQMPVLVRAQGTSMPINIPALAGRLSATADADDHIHGATFVPPHLIEQQKVRLAWLGSTPALSSVRSIVLCVRICAALLHPKILVSCAKPAPLVLVIMDIELRYCQGWR